MDIIAVIPFLFVLSAGIMIFSAAIPHLRKRLVKARYIVILFLLLFLINFLILTRFDAQMGYYAHNPDAELQRYSECVNPNAPGYLGYEECSARYNGSIRIDWSLPEPVEQYWRWLIIPPPLRPTCENVDLQICEITYSTGTYTSYSYHILLLLSGLAPFISVAATWFILKSRQGAK